MLDVLDGSCQTPISGLAHVGAGGRSTHRVCLDPRRRGQLAGRCGRGRGGGQHSVKRWAAGSGMRRATGSEMEAGCACLSPARERFEETARRLADRDRMRHRTAAVRGVADPKRAPTGSVGAWAVTSRNGAEALDRLADDPVMRKRPVFAVGDRTAEVLRDAGFPDVEVPMATSRPWPLGSLAILATPRPRPSVKSFISRGDRRGFDGRSSSRWVGRAADRCLPGP